MSSEVYRHRPAWPPVVHGMMKGSELGALVGLGVQDPAGVLAVAGEPIRPLATTTRAAATAAAARRARLLLSMCVLLSTGPARGEGSVAKRWAVRWRPGDGDGGRDRVWHPDAVGRPEAA